MSNTAEYRIIVRAEDAVKVTEKVAEGFDDVEKSSEKASKQNKKSTKTTKEAAQGMTKFSGSLRGASSAIGAFEGPFGGVSGRLSAFAGLIDRASTAMKAQTATAKGLRIALIALPFVAIATVAMTLFKAFASTQEGMDRINAVLIPMRAIMGRLWGAVQQLGIAFVNAFTNPVEFIKNLGKSIVDFVMRRITEVGNGIAGIGKAFSLLKEGKLVAAYQQASKAAQDLLTGTNPLAGLIKDGKDEMDGLVESMREAEIAGKRIAALEKEIIQARIDQTVPMAKLKREYQELRNVARDTTKTDEERLTAVRRAISLSNELAAMEREVLDLEIEQLELKNSINDTSDEEKLQLQKLIAQREDIVAGAEREQGRLIVREASIIKSIEGRISAEEDANIAAVQGMQERADAYRQLLVSEADLRQQAFDDEVAKMDELIELGHLKQEDADAIIADMQKRLNEEKFSEELAFLERLRELDLSEEEKLIEKHEAELQLLKTAHENNLIEEEEYLAQLKALQERHDDELNADRNKKIEEKKKAADEEVAIEKKKNDAIRGQIAKTMGDAVAAGIMQMESAKDAGKAVIDVLAKEAGAAAARWVMRTVPFPASLALAPIAGALATKLVGSFANFNTGGLVGDRFGVSGNFGKGDNHLIAANKRETILTPEQVNALGGASAMARAGVPGYSGGQGRVSLDASGFSEAVANMPKEIIVNLNLDDTVNKIQDRQNTNKRREVFVE